jgi:hypothetical protein
VFFIKFFPQMPKYEISSLDELFFEGLE